MMSFLCFHGCLRKPLISLYNKNYMVAWRFELHVYFPRVKNVGFTVHT